MRKARGTVEVFADRCKGCDLCVVFCPPGVLRLSERVNVVGYRYVELADASGCTGCEICGRICPDLAIHVYREPRRQGAYRE